MTSCASRPSRYLSPPRTLEPCWCPCGARTVLRIASSSSPHYVRGHLYLVCSRSLLSRQQELGIQHHWSLVLLSSILPQLCRRLHFDDTLFSSALQGQLCELLPDDSTQTLVRAGIIRALDQPPPAPASSQRTLPFDTAPPPYIPRGASLTPSAEDSFLRLLLPIIALGASAFIPSLLLALVLLVLTLRALLLYTQRLRPVI